MKKGINTGSKMFRSEPEEHYHQTLYSNCALLVRRARLPSVRLYNCALLVLNGTSLNSINALLAISRRIVGVYKASLQMYSDTIGSYIVFEQLREKKNDLDTDILRGKTYEYMHVCITENVAFTVTQNKVPAKDSLQYQNCKI